jgi:hypothetical protein
VWGDDSLKKYDLVLLSCEGNTFGNRKLPAMRQAFELGSCLGPDDVP